jgi:hypothetical protein
MKYIKLFENLMDDSDHETRPVHCTILPINRSAGTTLTQRTLQIGLAGLDRIKTRFENEPDSYTQSGTRTLHKRIIDRDTEDLLKFEPLLKLSPADFENLKLDAKDRAMDFVKANGLELTSPRGSSFRLPIRLNAQWKSYCETETDKLIKDYVGDNPIQE